MNFQHLSPPETPKTMIAANFRRFPEALLHQMELRLDETAQYFQDLTPPVRAIWSRLLAARKPDKSATAPQWWTEMCQRAKQLAMAVKQALGEPF
jgi:hypothetical protein